MAGTRWTDRVTPRNLEGPQPNYCSGSLLPAAPSNLGRPHWILIDEAHHMLPASNDIATVTLPKALPAATT